MLQHLDLFSGIGGFALAAEWAGFPTIGFVEIDKYCQAVLRKHWPDVPIVEDIKNVDSIRAIAEPYSAILVTAGVPCQPASVAGKRQGKDDNRWLWPETFDVVRAIKPRWCLFENVAGILALEQGMVIDDLLFELEGIGYAVATFIIPACAVNAWHRRDRIWIVANSVRRRKEPWPTRGASHQPSEAVMAHAGHYDRSIVEITGDNGQASGHDQKGEERSIKLTGPSSREGRDKDVANTAAERLQGMLDASGKQRPESRDQQLNGCRGIPDGSQWAFEPEVGRVAHGIPNRVDRLKCLGNAIVPQVAYQIIRVIAEIEGGQN